MFTRFRSKLLGAATLATGLGLTAYYLHQNFNFIDDDYRSLVKTLQAKSTVITLSNETISKKYGPMITSTIHGDEFIDTLTPEVKHFSFGMNVRQGDRDEKSLEDFGEVMVSVTKIDDLWHIDSIQIRFINSNYSKWLKLYECLQLKNKNTHSSSVKFDELLASPSLTDSRDYLKNFRNKQTFILKSIELFLSDREKLNSIGTPVRLTSHDLYESDLGYLLKMSIEGRRKNADLLVDVEEQENDWIISAMALMHEIKEDFILSNKELAEKYYNELVKNISNEDWQLVLNETNLKKLLEEKLIKHERIMTTIGRPIQLQFVETKSESGNIASKDSAQVKLLVKGRLNDGEFSLTLKKEQATKKWNITQCEFKMLWDGASKVSS